MDFSSFYFIVNQKEDSTKRKSFLNEQLQCHFGTRKQEKGKDTHEIINFGECWISISKSEILFVSAIHVLVLLLTRHDENLHSWRSNNSQCCISCNEILFLYFTYLLLMFQLGCFLLLNVEGLQRWCRNLEIVIIWKNYISTSVIAM